MLRPLVNCNVVSVTITSSARPELGLCIGVMDTTAIRDEGSERERQREGHRHEKEVQNWTKVSSPNASTSSCQAISWIQCYMNCTALLFTLRPLPPPTSVFLALPLPDPPLLSQENGH